MQASRAFQCAIAVQSDTREGGEMRRCEEKEEVKREAERQSHSL